MNTSFMIIEEKKCLIIIHLMKDKNIGWDTLLEGLLLQSIRLHDGSKNRAKRTKNDNVLMVDAQKQSKNIVNK